MQYMKYVQDAIHEIYAACMYAYYTFMYYYTLLTLEKLSQSSRHRVHVSHASCNTPRIAYYALHITDITDFEEVVPVSRHLSWFNHQVTYCMFALCTQHLLHLFQMTLCHIFDVSHVTNYMYFGYSIFHIAWILV